MGAPRATVISGAGRYSDPWHPFAQTSAAVADLLGVHGLSVQVHPTDTGPPDLSGVDLLVVNSGGGSTRADDEAHPDTGPLRGAVLDFVRAGGPALVVHTGSNTFYETEEWAALIGGRWVPGLSMHPPLDVSRVSVREHPITSALPEPVVRDERYCHLQVAPSAEVLISHTHEGVEHALMWTHRIGELRVIHNALGHDAEAYTGTFRRALLTRELDWLLG